MFTDTCKVMFKQISRAAKLRLLNWRMRDCVLRQSGENKN
jgi:hypothetical protein